MYGPKRPHKDKDPANHGFRDHLVVGVEPKRSSCLCGHGAAIQGLHGYNSGVLRARLQYNHGLAIAIDDKISDRVDDYVLLISVINPVCTVNVCMYMYICMGVHAHIYMHTYVCITYIYICFIHTCLYTSIYIYTDVRICLALPLDAFSVLMIKTRCL